MFALVANTQIGAEAQISIQVVNKIPRFRQAHICNSAFVDRVVSIAFSTLSKNFFYTPALPFAILTNIMGSVNGTRDDGVTHFELASAHQFFKLGSLRPNDPPDACIMLRPKGRSYFSIQGSIAHPQEIPFGGTSPAVLFTCKIFTTIGFGNRTFTR